MRDIRQYWECLHLVLVLSPAEAWDAPTITKLQRQVGAFNLIPHERNEAELGRLLGDQVLEAWLVQVSDRFGDYGSAGVLAVRADGDILDVDTWILSCRVLGKGVEQDILRRLAAMAAERGCSAVRFTYQRSAKNELAGRFISRIGEAFLEPHSGGGFSCVVPLTALAQAAAGRAASAGASSADSPRSTTRYAVAGFIADRWASVAARERCEIISDIAGQLRREEDLLAALRKSHEIDRSTTTAYVAPRDELESVIAAIWMDVLGVDNVGIHDHFFNLGGHSLLVTQVLAQLNEVLNVRIPLQHVFETPTVAQLAESLTRDERERARLLETARLVLQISEMSDEQAHEVLVTHRPADD